MKLLLVILALLIPLHGYSSRYKYDVSMCAIFQNEAPYLKEWIEYHQLIGVDHFWLYNNNSSDDYLSVLTPYIHNGTVDLIDWPSPADQDWTPYQKQAYNDCIKRVENETKWLAILDIDEFIVISNKKSLSQNLKPYDKFGGLFLFWQMFGTSGLWDIPEGKCMIECLTMKAPVDFPPNHQVKSICRPKCVSEYQVHGAHYKTGYYDVSLNGRGGPFQPIQLTPMHINHYWTRTEKFFYETKVARRERCENRIYTDEIIQSILSDYNCVTDTSILPKVPALKARLNRAP